jgi:hypothetical protein
MRVYGNLMNRVAEHSLQPKPEVGMGATIYLWSDRLAGSVIRVTKSGKTAWIQEDRTQRTDKNGQSEVQDYTFTADPDGRIFRATLRKDGTWRAGSNGVTFGRRDAYRDPSF